MAATPDDLERRIAELEEKIATLPEWGMRLRVLERMVARLSAPADGQGWADPEAEDAEADRPWTPKFHDHE